VTTHTDAEFEQIKAELDMAKNTSEERLLWAKELGHQIDDLRTRGDDATYQRECFEALQAIPAQFVESDYWVNGITRLASALSASQAQVAKMREALEYVKESLEGRVGAEYVDRLDDLKLIDAALATTANAAQADLWLVWSNEHGAWWGPNESGYYTDIRSAGRYTKEKAMECADSRSHTKGKLPPEVIISERDAMEGKNPNAAQAGKAPQ
jgi:hypothetical protein